MSFATVYKIEALVFFKNVNSRASLDVSPFIQKIHVVQSSIIAVSVLGFGFRSSIQLRSSFLATDYARETELTTRRPPSLTSLLDKEARGPAGPGCQHEGKYYEDGAQVAGKDKCEHCYCMRDEIVCAIQECRPPCDGCLPVWGDKDTCCPEKYECCKCFVVRDFLFLFISFLNLFITRSGQVPQRQSTSEATS